VFADLPWCEQADATEIASCTLHPEARQELPTTKNIIAGNGSVKNGGRGDSIRVLGLF
jgi:hypothetical protein